MPFPPDVTARLASTYEELMWLANRPNVTARQARAWYWQVPAIPMAPKVRRFTGMADKARDLTKEQDTSNVAHRLRETLALRISAIVRGQIIDGSMAAQK